MSHQVSSSSKGCRPNPSKADGNPTAASRRRFLKTAAAAVSAPYFVSGATMGLGAAVPPSDRVTVGGIGIGRRGTYDLGCFFEQSDVQFLAVCDVKQKQRQAIKALADLHHGNNDCDTYQDFRELLDRDDIDAVLIATGPNWHGTAACAAARAGKDMYCEKPCTKNIAESFQLADVMRRTGRVFQAGTQRRNLPHFAFACELAASGRLGKLKRVYAHPRGMTAKISGWMPPEDAPPIEEVDWDMYLGPAAYRPYNHEMMAAFHFEKGGGFVGGLGGGGVLEWGSHCVDLCQLAAGADRTAPVKYSPPRDGEMVSTYASGVELVLRENDWLPLGSCPVRFEGEDGWVETGDSGKFVLSSNELLAGRKVEEIAGYPATFHVRDFLDCVKTRSQPKANAVAACYSHIACHAANIALFLDRELEFDPVKAEFKDDAEANRLRSEATRAPWRM
ncbi:Inositol 2-dehydrogenase [Crateriforma conspicua]|uniref:Inositol 2-dehydrogenase n=1 Tax=Crateriforma conspicua TaxID=2527996 RepID=A0A5C5YD39_9PLAN|nr:Inositol 2-dehydrogenase [Crateriforma conspicua]